MEETGVRSVSQEDPVEVGIAIHSSFLAGEFHGQRSLADYSPWGRKESHTTEGLTLSFYTVNTADLCLVLNLCCHLILLLSSSISTKLWGFQFIYLVSISNCSELLDEIGI